MLQTAETVSQVEVCCNKFRTIKPTGLMQIVVDTALGAIVWTGYADRHSFLYIL